jgi:hypothetical protein
MSEAKLLEAKLPAPAKEVQETKIDRPKSSPGEGIEALIKNVINESKKMITQDRVLKYEEGEIGITSLLQCPLKVEMRKKYPEIRTEAAAIDDGYRFEHAIKNALQRIFGDRFKDEFELPYEAFGQKIRGHLDCVVELDDKVIGLELKAPQLILLKKMPSRECFEKNVIVDSEKRDEYLIVNPTYKMQAKIEKFLLQRLYPDKEVELYLFQFGICKYSGLVRKFYTIYEVEAISEQDLEYLILQFLYDKKPRYKNECEYYCPYNLLCDKPFDKEVSSSYNLDAHGEGVNPQLREFINLYREYVALKEQMSQLEKLMKKAIDGSCVIGGREVGWVKREKVNYDVERIVEWLNERNVPLNEFLNVSISPKKRRFIEKMIPEAVLSKEEELVFKV